jgi:gas vesicle protein
MRDDRDITVIESDSGSGFKWFLIGAAIGAGIGVLFAPAAGDRTRRDLTRRGRKLRARAGEAIEEIADDIQDRGRKVRATIEDFAEEVVDEVQEGKRKLERRASSAREEMERRLADARNRARAAVGADGVSEDEESD